MQIPDEMAPTLLGGSVTLQVYTPSLNFKPSKIFDSKTDGTAKFASHTFSPLARQGDYGHSRTSVEARTFVLWDEESFVLCKDIP